MNTAGLSTAVQMKLKVVKCLPQIMSGLFSGMWKWSHFLPGSGVKKSNISFIIIAFKHSVTYVKLFKSKYLSSAYVQFRWCELAFGWLVDVFVF